MRRAADRRFYSMQRAREVESRVRYFIGGVVCAAVLLFLILGVTS